MHNHTSAAAATTVAVTTTTNTDGDGDNNHNTSNNAYIYRLRERYHLEDLGGEDGRIILEWNLRNSVWRGWTGLIWFRIGTSCRLL